MLRTGLTLLILAAATPALAAADLTASIAGPAGGATVYATGRYTATVSNIGNKSASNVVLTITLPATHTSPQVYPMGNVIALQAGCSRSNLVVTCNLGTVARNTTVTRWIDMQLPESAAPIVFNTSVSTTSAENSTANNAGSLTAAVNYIAVTVAGPWPRTVLNNHCTGTGLTAWFECTLFPSAISDHTVEFHENGGSPTDGTIIIPGYGDYDGDWSQPSPTELVFQYRELGVPVANFYGHGVGGNCFEGLTTFIPGPYVAPYEVCLQ